MKIVPLAEYLARRAPALSGAAAPAADAVRPARIDHAREIEQAIARGRTEGSEAAQRDHETTLKQLKDTHEAQLAQERQRWASEEAARLAKAIEEGLSKIESSIAETAAGLIAPLLEEAARRDTIAGLASAIRGLWEQEPGVALRVTGPSDLLDGLRERVAGMPALQFAASESCEMRVEADKAVIETALAPWVAQVREGLT